MVFPWARDVACDGMTSLVCRTGALRQRASVRRRIKGEGRCGQRWAASERSSLRARAGAARSPPETLGATRESAATRALLPESLAISRHSAAPVRARTSQPAACRRTRSAMLEVRSMRRSWLPGVLLLAACGAEPPDAATMGCTHQDERIIELKVSATSPCVEGTALLHEIGHVALPGDPDHADPRWSSGEFWYALLGAMQDGIGASDPSCAKAIAA